MMQRDASQDRPRDAGKVVHWHRSPRGQGARNPTSPRWNVFARELEDILSEHGIRLAQISTHTRINPAKVLRLRESLCQRQPKRLPLLPPEEVDEIARAFALSDDERMRLQVSVLVTAVERVLVNRLDPTNALLAAEQLFPEIERMLREHEGECQGIGLFAQGDDGLGGQRSDPVQRSQHEA